jgi:hypothetical protein
MQVKYNNQWHEVRAILADGVTQELTPDKIDDVRYDADDSSLNQLADENNICKHTIGYITVILSGVNTQSTNEVLRATLISAISMLDRQGQKLNRLEKLYEDDATESK